MIIVPFGRERLYRFTIQENADLIQGCDAAVSTALPGHRQFGAGKGPAGVVSVFGLYRLEQGGDFRFVEAQGAVDRPFEQRIGQRLLALLKLRRADRSHCRRRAGRRSQRLRTCLPGAIGESEAAGVVDAVGEGVDKALVGKRIAIAPAAGVLPLPEQISDEMGAQLIAMLKAGKGDWIIQTAANGAVARVMAIFWPRPAASTF